VLGKREFSELTPADLMAVLDGVQGCRASTANKVVFNAFRALLRDATRDGYASWDLIPTLYARLKRKTGENAEERRPLTVEERDVILGKLKSSMKPVEALFVRFLLFTGVRPNEALGLTWGRVCGETRRAYINEGIVDGCVTTLKTQRSRRWVEIPDTLWHAMPEHEDVEERVFAEVKIAKLRAAWNEIVQRMGLTNKPLYICRHTFISQALSSGVPLPVVAAQVGDNPSVVEKVYYRYLKSSRTDWDRALSSS
jgi:integrase